ncbi:HAMP domain-containing sensor histidine kinase [Ekhidna sp.]|uniref:HAMP domain-containing sensor histidine kinase n=2 Tax=Ekhidna sp. TaxID=2608089 RepID=UPI003298439B
MPKIFLDRKIYFLLFIAIIGGLIAYYFNYQLKVYEKTKRNDTLINVHQTVVDKFSESINRFAYLMSGLRSHLKYSKEFPNAKEMQEFVKYQAMELNMNDSLIVSFLNTDHEFIYSFTINEMDPNSLVGTSVRDFRRDDEIDRLIILLSEDHMRLFYPINLVEGWVGIPLNFPVIRDKEAVGYIASILNFRNIVEPIYKLEDTDVFTFKFSVKGGSSFDREQVYDGSKVYHDRHDDKYYKNYNIDDEKFMTSSITMYGLTFEIGTAYIDDSLPNPYIRWIFLFIYGLILCFSVYAINRYIIYHHLNERLKRVNEVILEQNTQLEELNATKDRLMSIIGHDLKGPISSIINLISLVEEDSITVQDTQAILKQLNPVAKNTINLLENLLQWAMVNSGNTIFKPEPIPIHKVVEENFTLLKPSASQKKINLKDEVPKNLNAYGDYNMISTVIRNLISNAIKYSESDTEVKISAQDQQNEVIIQVIDQGIGLSEKEIAKINSTEIQVSKKGTAGEKGTGLGLELCKAFLTKNNGLLEITSDLGSGSTFQLKLPKGG